MLSPDSPFRRLPADLPRRQVLFIDALRLSGQMTAFSRIWGMLAALEPSIREHSQGKELLGSDVVIHFSLQPTEGTRSSP